MEGCSTNTVFIPSKAKTKKIVKIKVTFCKACFSLLLENTALADSIYLLCKLLSRLIYTCFVSCPPHSWNLQVPFENLSSKLHVMYLLFGGSHFCRCFVPDA
jgi:hypothetical protein